MFTPSQENCEVIALVDGTVTLKDQLKDYQYRGPELNDMSYLTFMIETYEGKSLAEIDNDQARTRGRPRSQRVSYLPEAKKNGRCRIVRASGHETLPRFAGRWFPRNDRPDVAEYYSASMLFLLKPWRTLADLKSSIETFASSLQSTRLTGGKAMETFIENVQYYHLCSDQAVQRRAEENARENSSEQRDTTTNQSLLDFEYEAIQDEEYPGNEDDQIWIQTDEEDITEADIEAARLTQRPVREDLFATSAMFAAYDANIFDANQERLEQYIPVSSQATPDDIATFKAWDKTLKSISRSQSEELGIIDPSLAIPSIEQSVPTLPAVVEHDQGDGEHANGQEFTEERPKLLLLNKEQRRAHDIVERKLKEHLEGEPIIFKSEQETDIRKRES